MKGFREYKRWKWHYLLFLEFAKWSSSNSPRLHVQKVAAPRRPHGAAPWVPPLSTALPRSSPTWLGVWARLGHFACFYPQAECAAGSRTTKPLALALCRANKSWHPVDHYWQSCMRWDEAQRREVHSFFIYFILREAEEGGSPHRYIGHLPFCHLLWHAEAHAITAVFLLLYNYCFVFNTFT